MFNLHYPLTFECNGIKAIKILFITLALFGANVSFGQTRRNDHSLATDKFLQSFVAPPDSAKSRVYWFWIYNRVTKEGIARDLKEFKAKGISGVNLICNGGYAGKEPLLGVDFLGEEWRALFRYAVKEANRLHIELGFNLAGGWTFMGPSVTKDDAMKKVVWAEVKVDGGSKFIGKLPLPEQVQGYYHDIMVQAFRVLDDGKTFDQASVTDITNKLLPDGSIEWNVPAGKWVILRSGYTLTGHPWSKWKAYPEGDTFKGGEGYEIDYLSKRALDNYFNYLGKTVIAEAKKAGGHIDYLWSDSWECGKLTWTQDFLTQFKKFRGYDLKPFMPVLAGYVADSPEISERFKEDFDRTIQDCIAENCYGHFAELCHKNGMKVGSEAGGPNDIPPIDVLKNFSTQDIVAGEFWVNGHRNAPGGYNQNRMSRLNLKQTASAAHVYGKKQAEAEAFTEQEHNATHWTLGPSDLKPYANDAFCEGINRLMLHSATSQPPSDGKPGYEYCAGTHFTPNVTWWEESKPFFNYLNRCQFMLQQGRFAADVCYYLGERPPLLAPPKYNIPTLGPGFDCDYANSDVLLNRMSVKNGLVTLPDGMNYKMLVLQNCVSPVPEIAKQVGSYQSLRIPEQASKSMSLPVIEKIRKLVYDGATIVGPPPENAGELKNYSETDIKVKKIAAELWGDLDGRTVTERKVGKGRIIWGKTEREVLTEDGVTPDFEFAGQPDKPNDFDYIHRSAKDAEIFFVINRTNQKQSREFTFRVKGKIPEIWDAVTGKAFDATEYALNNGVVTIPLEFDSFGSLFIVFRKAVTAHNNTLSHKNFPVIKQQQELVGSWNVSFDPKWGGPANGEFAELKSWTDNTDEGIKYYSGTATYRKTFDLSTITKENAISINKKIILDLGDVKNVAKVKLNGKNLGVLWCTPWQVDITGAVKDRGNILEIEVTNLWANRVVHDLSLPVDKRLTKTHESFRFDMLNAKTPLLESGLLGPVWVKTK
ncbi:glycosyl transferase family 2 [Mucilaginibacter sp. SMC90]|uniref:glycosyl hydrolase n=1 Tax=Mucilaginibacter sp. SMC90 TaxID=2929803 RepID=UPI001FB1DD9B|nr:glycosyl hydrolase [Mucilaginibacter sp. SMC90]UOE52142.1 glycosyl transferase family 2 [Mucilaginibacter sp. SMC90]